ncbi:stage V sporulation protein K [Pullulanibacillus pueri]|uniref:Stage V sporulation protein K n=1 Tax=Pullulanibacillus pueri TaxID=1437324 RepID=A0A8J3A0C8_9BACL|nr:stage V sporulation protein K [Pullulanibacillus pueri]MBM7684143.1 stage V sporulation protein K [Pullulanibacillus pueri]GGH88764.1 stage V sporulation protein K [Pullulanibacillus pueri]
MSDTFTFKQKGQINVVLNQARQDYDEPIVKKQDSGSKHFSFEKIEEKLNQFVGMEEIKKTVKEIYAWIYVNRLRKQYSLKTDTQALHMLFKGNPGTGKTTVARLLGELFSDMGVLSKGHLIEAERADLVGEYIGQTAQKTRELIKKAQGGILFIDEAYSLARGGEKDFGKEAIDTLVKHMEDKKGEFILILAGYSDEMDFFMEMNPGLPSRFPIQISFPNYNEHELLLITDQMIENKEYKFTSEARKKLERHLKFKVNQHEKSFSNGRYVRNLVEKMIRQQAVRLLREGVPDRVSLLTIRSSDITIEEGKEKSYDLSDQNQEGITLSQY